MKINTEINIVLFLENTSNIILIGNSGVGKTYLTTSIGIASTKKRVSTYFIKFPDLIDQFKRAYLENKLESRIEHLSFNTLKMATNRKTALFYKQIKYTYHIFLLIKIFYSYLSPNTCPISNRPPKKISIEITFPSSEVFFQC